MSRSTYITAFIAVSLFCFSFFLRWYLLPDYLFFGFEQGRDAEQARAIYQLQDFTLVGPKTDIAGIFHGAWFYYLLSLLYFFGQGHPLSASFILVVVSSLVPVGLYVLFAKIFKGQGWGVMGGLLSSVSFDLITYSRWLSNISWSIPFLCLLIALLFKYRQTKNPWLFVAAVSVAALTAQFQIMLTLWLSVFIAALLLFRWMSVPPAKFVGLAVASLVIIYLPILAFNIKNNFISITSAYEYIHESAAAPVSLLEAAQGYGKQLYKLTQRSLINRSDWLFWIWVGGITLGALKASRYATHRYLGVFFGLLSCMTIPVLLFGRSLNLEQLYVGSSIGLIGLVVFSFWGWWRVFLGKFVVAGLVVVVVLNSVQNWHNIKLNSGFYFITIQEGLELQYQQQVLNYIRAQENGSETYFLKAFTIPYYQEQGWQYLRSYYLADLPFDAEASTIYVVIEPQVDPYWQQQWLKDLGITTIADEKFFGTIKVMKLERVQ